MFFEIENNNIEHIGYDISGPIAVNYAEWLISQAIQRNISTLYFLSRDGYLPWKATLAICQSRNIHLECRYLYVSRMALRTAAYCIMDDNMMDMLFHHTAYMTPKTLLSRFQFDEKEQKEIFSAINIVDENVTLNKKDLILIKEKLQRNEFFNNHLMEKSLSAYQMAIQYFKQEKVFEQKTVALVDSGWNGTLQKSINSLLKSKNYSGKIVGFYFGLVSNPKKGNGEYVPFYFSWKNGLLRKTMFDNNVFECLFPADHPMTIGYQKQGDTISPIFSAAYQIDCKKAQIFCALKYIDNNVKQNSPPKSQTKSITECYTILKQIMVFPTADELKTLGSILFCDDFTDGYLFPLVSESDANKVKQLTILAKIRDRLKNNKANSQKRKVFWEYGIVALQPPKKQGWYRFNVVLWNLIRHIKNI